MSGDIGLGKLITSPQQRDAVHVAVSPVKAGHFLMPGDHVGFLEDGRVGMVESGNEIGIVDPFLIKSVAPNNRFWLFLYPGTITSLRHDWSHPAFQDEMVQDAAVDPLKLVAERIASICGKTYQALMEDARRFAGDGNERYNDHIMDNSERYKDVPYDLWKDFWKHYEQVHGVKLTEEYDAPYTCSC